MIPLGSIQPEENRTVANRVSRLALRLPSDLVAAIDEAVAHGAAPSRGAFVERAVQRELREIRREMRQTQWEEASRDPLFLEDLEEIGDAFASADAEAIEEVR
jgi:hypothetical protein